MSIPKFRLAWKGGAQEQMNILEKMALLLENILNELQRANGTLSSIDVSVGSVDTKMTTQLLLSQEISDNTSCACNALKDVIANQIEQSQILNNDLLLSQQIADNTSCACNALGDVNGKLDEIIEIINNGTPPAPVYEFVLNTNTYTLTKADFDNGYFDVSGISTKDGVLFDSVTTDLSATWIGQCTVLPSGKIRIGIFKDELVSGLDTKVDLTQSESNIMQTLQVIYVAGIADEFRLLAQPSQIDYLDTRTEMTIDVLSYSGGGLKLPALGSNWKIASYEVIPFGFEGKSFYRLKVKVAGVTTFDQLVKIPFSIPVSSPVGSDTVNFTVSNTKLVYEPINSDWQSPEGVKGYNPYTYDSFLGFFIYQNNASRLDGGVSGVDWYILNDSTGITAVINELIPEHGGGIVNTNPAVPFTLVAPAGYWSSPQQFQMKYIVGWDFQSLRVDINITLPVGLPLMGGKTQGVSESVLFTIPFAPCPFLGPTLPMSWDANAFENFEYPVLPNGYAGSRTVGELLPVSPLLPVPTFKLYIGYDLSQLFLMQYGWSLPLKNVGLIVDDTYRFYVVVDRLACYSSIVITKR